MLILSKQNAYLCIIKPKKRVYNLFTFWFQTANLKINF